MEAAQLYAAEAVEWHDRNSVAMIRLARHALPTYEPGQFFFLNVPEISLNEWHPFTASAVLDDSIVFYVKKMGVMRGKSGKATWSARLAELAQVNPSNFPKLRLSGPLGHTDFKQYETLVLVAGGIGITPMIAIFNDLRHRQQTGKSIGNVQAVVLVWMSRSVGEFRLFEEIFNLTASDALELSQAHRTAGLSSRHLSPEMAEDASEVWAAGRENLRSNNSTVSTKKRARFDLRLHCTRRESWVSLTTPSSADYVRMFVANGRCNFEEIMGSYARHTRTMVAVCGPWSMTQDMSRLAWKHGCDFHSEQFHF